MNEADCGTKQPLTAEEEQVLKMNLMKSQAVRQALFEVMGEQRDEVIKRARAKLVGMGITIHEDDVEL